MDKEDAKAIEQNGGGSLRLFHHVHPTEIETDFVNLSSAVDQFDHCVYIDRDNILTIEHGTRDIYFALDLDDMNRRNRINNKSDKEMY